MTNVKVAWKLNHYKYIEVCIDVHTYICMYVLMYVLMCISMNMKT